jgi:hypothetical protein
MSEGVKKMWRQMAIILCALLAVSGCGGDSSKQSTDNKAPAAGTAATATDSPEVTAVSFFKAILVDNDIKAAKKHAAPSLKRVMDGYASAKAMSRTLLNMSFDTVEITVEDTNRNVREFYTDKADVMLIFTGTKNDTRVVNMRMLKMVKQNGKWQVNEIKDDPFARTGI